jgi:hypothetical protein
VCPTKKISKLFIFIVLRRLAQRDDMIRTELNQAIRVLRGVIPMSLEGARTRRPLTRIVLGKVLQLRLPKIVILHWVIKFAAAWDPPFCGGTPNLGGIRAAILAPLLPCDEVTDTERFLDPGQMAPACWSRNERRFKPHQVPSTLSRQGRIFPCRRDAHGFPAVAVLVCRHLYSSYLSYLSYLSYFPYFPILAQVRTC